MQCINCGEKQAKVKFCSKSCAATFNNKKRKIVKGKIKLINCTGCSTQITVGINSPTENVWCKLCHKNRYVQKYSAPRNKNCISCDEAIVGSYWLRYCPKCLKDQIRKGSNKSIELQGDRRRSKNEIYFAELCKKKFVNVRTNEKVFNGWDADVIIDDIKVAVLWNGKWHYEKLAKKHSVKQTQNRDRIKVENIKLCGFIPYIIKDMGSYDSAFVDKEFDKFIRIMGV